MSEFSPLIPEGLTYDDVLLVPAYSEILPRDVDTSTRFTRDIRLNIPIVTAAMDTVTEFEMAIAIAVEGGIGVLHKNMNIDHQAEQVRKVKRYESGMVQDPVTLSVNDTLFEASRLMQDLHIGGIPVTDNQNKLVGIITNRDLRFEKADSRPVRDLMTSENLITVPEGTTLIEAEEIFKNIK